MWTEYDEEGHLADIMEFSNGLAEGLWKSFHDNGQLKFEELFAMTSKMVGIFGGTVLDELLKGNFCQRTGSPLIK